VICWQLRLRSRGMPEAPSKQELVERVSALLKGDWTDEEMELLFHQIEQAVPCPPGMVQEIIFLTEGLTPQQMVDAMFAYRPIEL